MTARTTYLRIVPLCALVMFVGSLDRTNIAFAALTMNDALGLSNAVFGVATGCFTIGYMAFGIPSTLMLNRLGARRWLTILLIVWGACSAATALVTDAHELMLVRFLLGVAEAGVVPGLILFLSSWFPSDVRGRIMGSTLIVQPLTIILGAPISSMLLGWDGVLGLHGWQWLFIVEAAPTVVLAAAVYRWLPDRPAHAHWLPAQERERLETQLTAERAAIESVGEPPSTIETLRTPRIIALALVYLSVSTAGIGLVIFLALIIRSIGFSVAHTGSVAAVCTVIGAALLPAWGWWTDRNSRREMIAAAACLMLAVGLFGMSMLLPSPWALAPLILAIAGFYGVLVPFWTLPASFLTGASAATGIAFINITGNLGGLTGPALVGYVTDLTGSHAKALLWLSVVALSGAGLLLSECRRNASKRPASTRA